MNGPTNSAPLDSGNRFTFVLCRAEKPKAILLWIHRTGDLRWIPRSAIRNATWRDDGFVVLAGWLAQELDWTLQ
jgi:hypothetical protein